MSTVLQQVRTPTFRHADELVGAFGTTPGDARHRLGQAIPLGHYAVRTSFATIRLSQNAPRPHVFLGEDRFDGCAIEGHCPAARVGWTPGNAWANVADCECGSFNAMFWDSRRNQVKIRTDASGYRTLYYWVAPSEMFLLVASSLDLMRRMVGGLRPDRAAFYEQLLLSSTIGDRTLLLGVARLRPGVQLTLSARGVSTKAVKTADPWREPSVNAPIETSARRLIDLTTEVLEDWAHRQPARLALSGGFDSRLLISLCLANGTPVEAVTLGGAPWIDRRLAKEVTRRLRVPHRLISPPSVHTIGTYMRALLLTEHVSDYMSGFWLLRYGCAIDTSAVPILNGFLGGPVSGAATQWIDGRVRSPADAVRGWLRHVNRANLSFGALLSLHPRDPSDISEHALCARLGQFCPTDVPLFRALSALELQVRQFGFVSLGTYGLYRRFARPLVPLADFRLVKFFGGLPRHHLEGQRAYRLAIALVDRSGVAVASTSGRLPATFSVGPRETVERGFAQICQSAMALIVRHSDVVSELFDVRRLLHRLEDSHTQRVDHRRVPERLMLINAVLLWLAYSESGIVSPLEARPSAD